MFHLIVLLFYSALSVVFLRPLIPLWASAIPGGMEDTRLFLWNAWWFRHALDTLHTSPYFTKLLFHPFGASLLPHDFPLWTNLVTYAAQSAGLNLVAASNVWFILSWILAAFCTYLLVWEVTKARGPAVVAGLYVMTHSYLLARAMQNWGQFNIYGIALFLWVYVRARRTGRFRDYMLSGAALAWTAACHYYFLIYSGVIWLAVVAADHFPWRFQIRKNRSPSNTRRALFGGLALIAASVAAWIMLFHPGQMTVGSVHISLQNPANALLVMWLALVGWGLYEYKLSALPRALPKKQSSKIRGEWILALTVLLFLSPLLGSTLQLALSGDYPRQGILWKTHLPGANLLSLLMPNPLHAVWGQKLSRWYEIHGIQPQEQAASIGWVCLGIVLWSWSVSRRWLWLAVASTVLSMGVYLHILWYKLWLPLPFYLWRLIPILGNVRVPERWMAVGAIAWGVVLASAIVSLARKKGWSVNRVCLCVGALVLLENWPGIPLGVPPSDNAVYEKLRQLPQGGVLPLPLYIGDSSIGAGDAPPGLAWEALGGQIYHQQPLIGGYIGRISRRIIRNYKANPYFDELIHTEEEKPSPPGKVGPIQACQAMKEFDVSYVLLYSRAVKPAVFNFVTQTIPAYPIASDPEAELYRVNCR